MYRFDRIVSFEYTVSHCAELTSKVEKDQALSSARAPPRVHTDAHARASHGLFKTSLFVMRDV